jgi:uncharacterized protein YwgA
VCADDKIEEFNVSQKLILYAIGQSQTGIKTETHLQKLIFLTLNALDIDPERYGYYAYKYGPFSLMIREISDDMTKDGFLHSHGRKEFVADESILKKIEIIQPRRELDRFKIKEVAEFVDGLTRDEILLHTYVRYKNYAKESEILNDVLGKRVRVAADMYHKDKVTLSGGAELAGLPISKFKGALNMYSVV